MGYRGGSEECGFGGRDHGSKKLWWKGLSFASVCCDSREFGPALPWSFPVQYCSITSPPKMERDIENLSHTY